MKKLNMIVLICIACLVTLNEAKTSVQIPNRVRINEHRHRLLKPTTKKPKVTTKT